MASQTARVFLVEDYLLMVDLIKDELGGCVVLAANTREDALCRIREARALAVNVAIVDGELNHGPEDGEIVATALREKIPNIKIICFSSKPHDWGDVNLIKFGNTSRLNEVIASLLSSHSRAS